MPNLMEKEVKERSYVDGLNLMDPIGIRERMESLPPYDSGIPAGVPSPEQEALMANPPVDVTNLVGGFAGMLRSLGPKAALMALPGMAASEIPAGMAYDIAERYAGDNPVMRTVLPMAATLMAGHLTAAPMDRMMREFATEQVGPRLMNSLGMHVVEPRINPIAENAGRFPELWGDVRPQQINFDEIINMPEVRGMKEFLSPSMKSHMAASEGFMQKFGSNPEIRELAALYNQGLISTDDYQRLFRENLNRIEGKSAFDNIFETEAKRRVTQSLMKGEQPYVPNQVFPVSEVKGAGGNMKLAGSDIISGDTSKGCMGMCPECFAKYGQSGMKKFFCDPVPVKLTGDFYDNPHAYRRIGEFGEPNMNPVEWQKVRDEYLQKYRSGQEMTQQDLDEIIERAYNWDYTNEQLKNTNLHTDGYWEGSRYVPGGKDKTFLITKLQSLDGFDPDIIRNLEVSVDPTMPDHAFRSLKNIEELKNKYGDKVNITMRVRSIASGSDEINALQKAAVDLANKNDIPILETRLRFKNPDTMALSQPLPEYFSGGQIKHISYWPSTQPQIKRPSWPMGKKAPGAMVFRETEYKTPTGREPIGALAAAPANMPTKSAPWDVYGEGGLMSRGRPLNDAIKQLAEVAGQTPSSVGPGTIRDIAKGESPLSRFGLKPSLHHQCNVFNMSGNACKVCRECQMFTEEGARKAMALGEQEASK